MAIPSIVPAGLYQHYKGEYYQILGLGRHTQTEERLVVYVPLYLMEGPRLACRPAEEFFGQILDVDNDILVPRYRYVGVEPSRDDVVAYRKERGIANGRP